MVLALTLTLVLVLTLALAPSGMISKKGVPEFCPSTVLLLLLLLLLILPELTQIIQQRFESSPKSLRVVP